MLAMLAPCYMCMVHSAVTNCNLRQLFVLWPLQVDRGCITQSSCCCFKIFGTTQWSV